jgi:hypothetical protein
MILISNVEPSLNGVVNAYFLYLLYCVISHIIDGYKHGTLEYRLKKLEEKAKTLKSPGLKTMNQNSINVIKNQMEIYDNKAYWIGFWLLLFHIGIELTR